MVEKFHIVELGGEFIKAIAGPDGEHNDVKEEFEALNKKSKNLLIQT